MNGIVRPALVFWVGLFISDKSQVDQFLIAMNGFFMADGGRSAMTPRKIMSTVLKGECRAVQSFWVLFMADLGGFLRSQRQ